LARAVTLKRFDEALESYRKDLAIARKLAATDPGNPEWQHDLWVSHYKLGEVAVDAKRPEDALASYRDALAVLETLAASHPGRVRWQTDLVVNLFKLAQLGDEPLARLQQALAILRRLEAAGTLPENQKSWIPVFEQAIAGRQK
jgi:tetratricopeptide (TPR) repeat protein